MPNDEDRGPEDPADAGDLGQGDRELADDPLGLADVRLDRLEHHGAAVRVQGQVPLDVLLGTDPEADRPDQRTIDHEPIFVPGHRIDHNRMT